MNEGSRNGGCFITCVSLLLVNDVCVCYDDSIMASRLRGEELCTNVVHTYCAHTILFCVGSVFGGF